MKVIITILILVSNVILAAPADDFVIRIKSDNPGGSPTEFVIVADFSFNYNVDCNNDGTNEATAQAGNYTCDYSSSGAGTYTIRIKDNTGTGTGFTRPRFNSSNIKEKLLSVEQWGTGIWSDMRLAFQGAQNVVFNATDIPNLSNVTDMRSMFTGATLANPDTSGWDTSSVIHMGGMFSDATSANPDTSGWDTSSITDMSLMFRNATSANPDTSGWNTSSVTDMSSMFSGATSANPDTSGWDTSSVIDMSRMFLGATSANPDTSGWDTSSVIDMNRMFLDATSANPDTSVWVVSQVTDMTLMFHGVTLPTSAYENMLIGFAAQNLQNGVSFSGGNSRYCSSAAQAARASLIENDGWNITDGGVCNPSEDFVIRIKSDYPGGSPTEFVITAFFGSNYNVDCDNDGTNEATAQIASYTCDYSSSGAGIYTIRIKDNTGTGTGFTRPYFGDTIVKEKLLSVEQWGTGVWSNMKNAFYGAQNVVFNATDIPNFSNVTDMNAMFFNATLANPDTSGWDTSSVTDMSRMFRNVTSANPDTSGWDTSSVIDMNNMFLNATSANPDTSGWDTSSVTNMSYMFSDATLANPDTSNWDTSSVTIMTGMFSGATSANPDTSGWDTSSVTNMTSMFFNATSASPIISNWDVSSVTRMIGMFSGIALPTAEYDAALINFSTQNLKSNVNFGAGNSKFCSAAAVAARDSMISFNGWNITDGGRCDNMFKDGFESNVVVFKSSDSKVLYDFSEVEVMQEGQDVRLIAIGLDDDNQVTVKIEMRPFDGLLQIRQSHLSTDSEGEQIWTEGLWQDVYAELSEIVLW